MEIVLDGQTYNCVQDAIASFAQNAFLLLKTTHFTSCSPILLITQNSFFRLSGLNRGSYKVTNNRTVHAFYTGVPCGQVLHTTLAPRPPFYEPIV
jgi:hypothetical protein